LDLANEVYHIHEPQEIPLVMSPDETRRLLAVASNLKVRALLSLYGCGRRASEVVRTDDAARSSLATCPSVSRSIQARRPPRSSPRWFSRRYRGGFRKRPDATAANRPICLLQRGSLLLTLEPRLYALNDLLIGFGENRIGGGGIGIALDVVQQPQQDLNGLQIGFSWTVDDLSDDCLAL